MLGKREDEFSRSDQASPRQVADWASIGERMATPERPPVGRDSTRHLHADTSAATSVRDHEGRANIRSNQLMHVREQYPTISPEDVRPWLEIRRTLQRRHCKQRCRVELVGLLLVVAVGLGTARWVGPHVSVDLSSLSTVPESFGFVHNSDPPRMLVGYDPNTALEPADTSQLSPPR
jgi:hypothetical protein